MKVILNSDVKHLGEEGDVKIVANGYARNYLFPRNLALPYNDVTVAYFETRKEEIEAKKAQKRADCASLKEKLDAHVVHIIMPAGPNGKLYGAVTNLTVAEELAKEGFEIERKRIDIPGLTIKNVGKYVAHIRLYESAVAEVAIDVVAQEEPGKATAKPEVKPAKAEATESAPVEETTEQAE